MDFLDTPSHLYKWNKHDAKLKTRMKDSSTIQSVHQWLRKVESASETAINTACATDNSNFMFPKSHNLNSKNLSNHNTQNDAYSEAHELLNKWVTDKIRLDMDDDIYNYVNVTEMNKFEEKRKQNEFKLSDYLKDDDCTNNLTTGLLHISGLDYDKYDETYIAKDIVNEMLKKKFIDTKEILRKDEKRKQGVDIKAKIEMRHQVVKDRRDKRTKDLEIKRKEILLKKEAELQAKQMIMKEEQDKRVRIQYEQQLLEQETERLRKEMMEKRRQEELIKQKQKEYELSQLEREKEENMKHQKLIDYYTSEYAVDVKRKEMEEKRTEDLFGNVFKGKKPESFFSKSVQKLFSIWYGLVLEYRLKTGKAKALYDWKTSQKVFNSWKKYCLNQRIQREQEIHENLIRIQNMKNNQAVNYYNFKLTTRCFEIWKGFNRNERLSKQLEEDKQKTKSKMQMFLDAASKGQLTKQQQPHYEEIDETSTQETSARSQKSQAKKESKKISVRTRSASSTSRTKDTESNFSSKTPSKLNSDDLILDIPDSDRDMKLNKQIREILRPWLKPPPSSSQNYDNRYKAHEKLFQEQHKMIKEQQKIIEEMKYQQNQVLFKEQIALLEQIKIKQEELEKMQKAQYQKEKRLIREAALLKNTKKIVKTVEVAEKEKEEPIVVVEEDDTPRQQQTNRRLNSFLQNMEDRAKQREQMRKEREERKLKEDMEKMKVFEQQEAIKRRIDEEERRKQNEEFKEKRKLEKEMKEKREAEMKREKYLDSIADAYYKKYLLRHYCMNGLKKLIQIRDRNMRLAIQAYECHLMMKSIKKWHFIVQSIVDIKNYQADRFYKGYLLRLYFKNGCKMLKISVQLEIAKANRFYKYNLKLKLFQKWKFYKNMEIIKFREYDTWLDEWYRCRVKAKYFKLWKAFPDEMKKLREREKRRNELRNKVQQLIPDFHTQSVDVKKSVESTVQAI